MPTGPTPSFDPAAIANALANTFYAASNALDRFRLSFDPPLPSAEYQRLKDEATALEMRGQHFTALAIGAILAAVQPDLDLIQRTTAEAVTQLQHIRDVERGIAVATSLLSLGTAIAAGDPLTVVAAVQGLAETVA